MMLFPTDKDETRQPPVHLPLVVHPTYPLKSKELANLAPLLRINARVLANNYEHHVGKEAPKLFTCMPYSRLKMKPGEYAAGITVLPLSLLRYGVMRTEYSIAMCEAARGVGRGLTAKRNWSEAVKDAFDLMNLTAEQVRGCFPAATMQLLRSRLTYHTFADPTVIFSIYELHTS